MNTIYKVGFWSGTIALVSTVAFVIVQMLSVTVVTISKLLA